MSDERWKDPPPPPPACRLYVAPGRPDYVTADEMDAWLDKFERATGTGKHRPKPHPKPSPPIEPRDRGDGQFGTEEPRE